MRAEEPDAVRANAAYPWPASRWWRTAPWSRNPLLRVSDRFESGVRVMAIVVALGAVPVCGAIGTAGYTDAQAEIRADNAAKTQVTATITDEPVRVSAIVNDTGDNRYETVVRWSEGGETGQASTDVDPTARPGDHVTLWVGRDGRPTNPPVPVGTAAWRGIGLALGFLVEIGTCIAVMVWLTTWLVDRCHRAQWAREWRTISRPIEQDKQ
ncbi:Rv1733c family protein [Nocardia wallacei]|uniref:Membrane protein n=1 Tax=Nocardia wallacei TaxID=480035 RepID=A0A7G1KMH6_9NOCA|nr:membrane protein [Nocardia wallacei]